MTDEIPVKELIRRCNAAIIERKRMLRRPHDDDSPAIQRLLRRLAWLATVLHVHQATRRGRRHGTMFESLDAQRAWLADRWPPAHHIEEVLPTAA
jgi:hypothetical protein